jgi:dihydropteroate synthase
LTLAKLSILTPKKTFNVNGHLIDFSSPKVMGILNVTPDSFYAGSRQTDATLLKAAETMLKEGATFLDIGGYSSRPGAADVPEEEEINRIAKPIALITRNFPEAVISIDTFRSNVVKAAFDVGATVINDISGGQLDPKMLETAGRLQAPFVGMHMRGTPQTMKALTDYDDLLMEVMSYFGQMMEKCKEAGILDVAIDPGFGFAKTIDQNYFLLNHLPVLKQLQAPILVGVSRKSMIWKFLEIEPSEALNGTTALNSVALLKGANILRVHDVKEAVQAVKLIGRLDDTGI